jgi:DNA replication protein DnaC
MTPLHEKLQRLKLPVMHRQLDQVLSDAAAQNWSMAQALERLADLELEDHNRRAVERRFRASRLQTQYSIDAFHFNHHKSRQQNKTRILSLLDLEFMARQKKSWVESGSGSLASE